MALSSFLLGSQELDTELDSLFQVQTPIALSTASSLRTSTKNPSQRKRKLHSTETDAVERAPKKRVKSDSGKRSKTSTSNAATSLKVQKNVLSEGEEEEESEARRKKGKEKEANQSPEDDEDSVSSNHETIDGWSAPVLEPPLGSDEKEEGDYQRVTLVHESLMKHTKKQTKKKHVRDDETREMRDRRTIFVGNLPLEILSKKPLKKQLQRHVLSFVPSAKIESIRFRSIPFRIPTSKLPTSEDEGTSKPKAKPKKPDLREHTKERLSLWRRKVEDKDEENVKADEKRYLTPAQKKKIAYIHQDFHSSADTVNAYIVFAYPVDPEDRPTNLPPLPPTMDPYQAALQAAAKANGSPFMERVIRVDLASKTHVLGTTTGTLPTSTIHEPNPRLSIFIGNLDFASKEEDLRAFFEALMSTERGPPSEGADSDDDHDDAATKVPPTWVTRVRIIRDRDTQLGKGFAYVQFCDKECVDEILAMEESKLKFAKRKLRVQRCKTIPGAAKVVPTQSGSSRTKSQRATRTTAIIPKADPSLGEKLSGLSKEQRKTVKATDPLRMARRLAKKKARMGMKPSVGSDLLKKQRKRMRSQI